MESELILSLVETLYEAALEPDKWDRFCSNFADATNSAATLIHVDSFQNGGASIEFGSQYDEAAGRAYEQYYASVNPITALGRSQFVPGKAVFRQMCCSEQALKQSEYYNDFFRHLDYFEVLGGCLWKSRTHCALISNVRSFRTGPYAADELELQQQIMPHLRQALKLHAKVSSLAGLNASLSTALDMTAFGVVFLDSTGAVLWMNREAERITTSRDGLCTAGCKLAALERGASDALAAQVTNALTCSKGENCPPAEPVRIPRASGRRDYVAAPFPLKRSSVFADAGGPACVIFLMDPEVESPDREAVLRSLFALSKAEATVAGALLMGDTPERIAERLSISLPTVRTHLARVFAKTETRTQADLIRCMNRSLPPVRKNHSNE